MKHRGAKANPFYFKNDFTIDYSFEREIAHLSSFFGDANCSKESELVLKHSTAMYSCIEGIELCGNYFTSENKQLAGQKSTLFRAVKDKQDILIEIRCINKMRFSGSCKFFFWIEALEIERLSAVERLSLIPVWIAFRSWGNKFSCDNAVFYFAALSSVVDFWKESSISNDNSSFFHDIKMIKIPNEILTKGTKKKPFKL